MRPGEPPATDGDGLALRPIATVEELRACEDLQVGVWGYSEREIVPKNELIAAQRSGGSLLGAFQAGELVAFAFAIPGWDGRRPYLSSRLVAVREGSRSQGLGERLKRAQRDEARALGYSLVRWTQDPLQAANARLNFRKLGATASRYVVDYYGSTSSPLHGSLPTDRLELDWELASPHVLRRLGEAPGVDPATVPESAPATSVLDSVPDPRDPDAPPLPGEPRPPPPGAEHLTLSVPPSLARCLERDPGLARAWRLATRAAFQAAIAAGFTVVDFLSSKAGKDGGVPRYYLVITKPNAHPRIL